MKRWKPVSITAAAAVLAATLGAGLTSAATPDQAVRASRTTLTVSVTGPQTVTAGVSCTWQAQVSGGIPPYTYSWTTRFSQSTTWSTDPTFSTSFSYEGPDLTSVQVEDAYGNQGSAGYGVYVTHVNRNC